jgi:REP element-mobilizing transposase RayT
MTTRKKQRWKQLELLPRKRKTKRGRPVTKGVVLHRVRPLLKARFPLHVTLKIRKDVGSLRTDRRWAKIQRAFRYGCDRFGMRLVEFAVLDNHIHLVVEAADKRALSRGMQGLAIRIARGINRLSQRKGKVFADRYHARPLKTLTEVRHAVEYVRRNLEKHLRRGGHDPHPGTVDDYSSMSGRALWYLDEDWYGAMCVAAPLTWFLKQTSGNRVTG